MEELLILLNNIMNENFLFAVISNPRLKEGVKKIKVRQVSIKGRRMFQLESFTDKQAFHENLDRQETIERFGESMKYFRQAQIAVKGMEYIVLISKKGKVTIKKRAVKKEQKLLELSHDKKKQYILQEGMCIPFLQDLGVMTQEGKIVRTMTDKFRQINRFLEFIEDVLPKLDKNREVSIVDFGCGKSYLTFAMYYYLHEIKHYDIRIIGLDLKKEVIENCNHLAVKYGYDKLKFLVGDIAEYKDTEKVDMVVTLHACDTATDYALAKAMEWKAEVILSVPCCQHELNGQIKNEILSPVMEYGILKERFAALVTDGLRGKYLEKAGYDVQMLEFIDMEHTPKNILIRAVRTGRESLAAAEQIRNCEEFLNGRLTLGRLSE